MIVKFHKGFNKWYISEDGGISWYTIGKSLASKLQTSAYLHLSNRSIR